MIWPQPITCTNRGLSWARVVLTEAWVAVQHAVKRRSQPCTCWVLVAGVTTKLLGGMAGVWCVGGSVTTAPRGKAW